MAGFNEILVGRFARGIQKLTGIKGSPPTPALSSEITGTLAIAEEGVENRYLFGWQRFMAFARQAGVVAQQTNVRFRNPVGSNIIAVIEQVWLVIEIAGQPAFTISRGTVSTDLASVVSILSSRLDARGSQASVSILSSGNNDVGFGGLSGRIMTGGLGPSFILMQDEHQEWPVLPGDGFQFNTIDSNVAVTCSLLWRERFLEESERS